MTMRDESKQDPKGDMKHGGVRKQTIWDVLNLPRVPSLLTSPAPGTGPYQHDTLATQAPQAFGGKVIPTLQKPNATGYGGGGDIVENAGRPAEEQHIPSASEIHAAVLRRYPTVAHHGAGQITLPRFNQLYDTLRTDRAWMYTADAAISGTITPAVGTVSTLVALPANQGLRTIRLSEFPGGIQAHLFLQQWGVAATAATMTGSVYFYFVDSGGSVMSLSVNNSPNYNTDLTNINKLATTPISDAGNTALGTLYATSTTVATPVACQWFLAFSLCYVLPDPAYNGYSDELVQNIRNPQGVQLK